LKTLFHTGGAGGLVRFFIENTFMGATNESQPRRRETMISWSHHPVKNPEAKTKLTSARTFR